MASILLAMASNLRALASKIKVGVSDARELFQATISSRGEAKSISGVDLERYLGLGGSWFAC